ncbi:unnamed protein product [Peniophora sp. CBMAI 1063]|nr:unnamed protein product [Peniophora sp. CBMAI 1063]
MENRTSPGPRLQLPVTATPDRSFSVNLDMAHHEVQIPDRDGCVARMKELSRWIFTSEKRLRDARHAFSIATGLVALEMRHDGESSTPDTSDATYLDFYHALDYRPNFCSVEAMALVLHRMQLDGCDPVEMAAHIDAMKGYWKGAAQ